MPSFSTTSCSNGAEIHSMEFLYFYGAPFVSKLFVNVLFNVVVTYPIKCSCDIINQPLLLFTLISFYGS